MKKLIIIILLFATTNGFAQNVKRYSKGEKAPDFVLNDLSKNEIQLSKLNTEQTVVLVVLRGWPGYQCPVCSRQVGELIESADKFSKKNAAVLFVYPGPSNKLADYATEFSSDFSMPNNFYFVLDPDYSMINKYGLRWDAPKETAYPATFVVDKTGEILFSKISETHGGRSKVEEILQSI